MKPSKWHGMDTFPTQVYNYVMPNVDDDTQIIKDNSSKNIDNYTVKVTEDGFDLLLLHSLKITDNHVDEAEIVGTWHFGSLQHLEFQGKLIFESVRKHK